MNVGIVGLGQIGIQHAIILNSLEECKVKAICEKESFVAKLASNIIPDIAFYSDYSKMIKEEVLDAIFVATPTPTHQTIVSDIMRQDQTISIFVEKPLAGDSYQASKIVEAARQSKGKMTVGFQKRFSGTFRRAKELLMNQAIGEIVFFKGNFYTSGITREGRGWKYEKGTGGVARDFSPHLIDLLLWFFGDPVSSRSSAASLYSTEVEDYIHSIVTFESGLNGSLDVSWVMPEYSSQELLIEIYGRNGFLKVTDDKLVIHSDKSIDGLREGLNTFYAMELTPRVPFLFAEPEYVLQDQCFMKCVSSGEELMQNFHTALKVNKFIDMILNGVEK